MTDDAIAEIVEDRGGFDLWCSRDGNQWLPITQRGFGNRMSSARGRWSPLPVGLFVGAANPLRSGIAVRTDGRWHYVLNDRGGLEVFHGNPGRGGA